MTRDTVEDFVRYQETGEGFRAMWVEIEAIVRGSAERHLVKMGGTMGSAGSVDQWALADVVDATMDRLLALSRPNARGRFDPAKTRRGGMDGFRGWLWMVTRNMALDWVRQYRCRSARGRSGRFRPAVRMLLESDFADNAPGGDGDASLLKSSPARFSRMELLPLLEECINQIEDPWLRKVVAVKLDVSSTERDMAKRLNMPAATFRRRLHRAYDVLRPMLEARGVEPSWFKA